MLSRERLDVYIVQGDCTVPCYYSVDADWLPPSHNVSLLFRDYLNVAGIIVFGNHRAISGKIMISNKIKSIGIRTITTSRKILLKRVCLRLDSCIFSRNRKQ